MNIYIYLIFARIVFKKYAEKSTLTMNQPTKQDS